MRGSVVKCGEKSLEKGERVCQIPQRHPMSNNAMETVKHI